MRRCFLLKSEKINPKISEIYFAKSSIYIKNSELNKAKIALKSGLEIKPDNLMQFFNRQYFTENYLKAIKKFNEAIKLNQIFGKQLTIKV